jgi:hypothetical protein
MINWGLVQGKAQTHLPWDSWQQPYTNREPSIWFHEVFRTNGTPYIPEEAEYIRRMTGRGRGRAARAASRAHYTAPPRPPSPVIRREANAVQ